MSPSAGCSAYFSDGRTIDGLSVEVGRAAALFALLLVAVAAAAWARPGLDASAAARPVRAARRLLRYRRRGSDALRRPSAGACREFPLHLRCVRWARGDDRHPHRGGRGAARGARALPVGFPARAASSRRRAAWCVPTPVGTREALRRRRGPSRVSRSRASRALPPPSPRRWRCACRLPGRDRAPHQRSGSASRQQSGSSRARPPSRSRPSTVSGPTECGSRSGSPAASSCSRWRTGLGA